MAFSINTNIASLQSQDYLRVSSDFQTKTINRVTSGLRIISSGDDAAGLAIANGFRSDRAVLMQGVRNANDGLSALQTIDGGINNISQLLDRARTLAAQSASGTLTSGSSRAVLNDEFQNVLSEISRQAQAIGLDRGGQFAKTLKVFIGGGLSNNGVNAIDNGSVSVNLSASTVDTQSLGLSGVRAASAAGTDLSTSSATTSVQSIVNDLTNKNSTAVAGFSDFFFRGSGFSDADRVKVSVNMAGVTNTSSLAEAINTAITSAANGTTAAAGAFKAANIKAVVVSDAQGDGSVKERLGFVSSNGAFQVSAGDRMANALLGNFVSGATGKALETVFVGNGAVTGTSTGAGAANVIVRVQGSGLAAPVDLTLAITQGTTTAAQLATALKTAVDGNDTLKAAGITLDTPVAGEALVFRSRSGERFEVLAAGDNDNLLGLGTWRLASDTATSFDYTSVTGGAVSLSTTSAQTFEFSIGGGAKQQVVVNGLTAGTVTAAVNAINAGIAANATLAAAGLQASVQGGVIQIASTNGSYFRMNALVPGQDDFGFGTNATTGAGVAYSANYADALYNSIDGPYNIGATNDKVYVSINGGAAVEISITQNAATTVTTVANDLNANGTFAAAATAYVVNGQLVITADNPNTKIEFVDGANSAYSTIGWEVGQSNYAAKATVNSGGAYHTAVGDAGEVYSFNTLRDGGSDQTITLTAIDSGGVQHSLAVNLTNANARSLDEAIKTINTQLQQSGDPTLKQLVAVKEKNAGGTEEGVRFLSTLSNFRVSVGASGRSTAANETGIFDGTSGASVLGQGLVTTATQSEGGSQLDITTEATAAAAVTALAEAVTILGNAQAVVGKGQNNFTYAINLASTQLNNLAASESRIRDADLAMEAANLTKAQILIQAGIAALAQANSSTQAVLGLLRG